LIDYTWIRIEGLCITIDIAIGAAHLVRTDAHSIDTVGQGMFYRTKGRWGAANNFGCRIMAARERGAQGTTDGRMSFYNIVPGKGWVELFLVSTTNPGRDGIWGGPLEGESER